MRPLGERSLSVDLPAALAASLGRPGTLTSTGGPLGSTSSSRTAFSDRASTKAVCGKVSARNSGLRWKRSETSTCAVSRLARRKVSTRSGVLSTARLLAWKRQNSSSSIRSRIGS